MKKSIRRLAGIVLGVIIALSLIPAAPEQTYAASKKVSAPKKAEFFLMYEGCTASFQVKNVTATGYVDVTSVKVANENVATFYRVGSYLTKTAKRNSSTIYLRLKAIGMTAVTYTVGGKTYTTNVTVKPYQNPIKSISMTGVNSGSDFAALSAASTEVESYANGQPLLNLAATAMNPKLKIKTSGDWRISNVYLYNRGVDYPQPRHDEYWANTTAKWSKKTFTFSRIYKAEQGRSAGLEVYLVNRKNGQSTYVYYSIY